MALRWGLIAALALASLTAAVQGDNSPSVCAYSEDGLLAPEWAGNCGPNPEYLVTLQGVSPLAKFVVAQAKAQLACSKHNVTAGAPADVAKCVADKANWCYLDGQPGAWVCGSNAAAAAFVSIPCPGSIYGARVNCNAKYEADCTGACKWRVQILAANYTRYLEYKKASGGAYGTVGFCEPDAYTKTFTTKAQWQAWFISLSPPASNATAFAAVRGTCPYAVNGRARFTYDDLCSSLNNAKNPGLGLMLGTLSDSGVANFKGIDAAAATKCLKAGCGLDYVPGDVGFGFGGQDFYQCGPEPVYRYSLGYYTPQDKNFLNTVRVCADPSVRFNKARCLAATI